MQIKTINEFRKNFNNIYHNKVVSVLKDIDQERIKSRNIAFLFSIIVFIAVTCFSFIFMVWFSLVLGLVATWATFSFFSKDFEKNLKTKIMPILMHAFGDFRWLNVSPISDSEILASKLYTRFEKSTEDDNFIGSYNGIPIKLTETKLTYETRDSRGHRHTHTEFKGVIISIKLPKKFTGHTLVTKRGLLNIGWYNEVKLEDPEFSKQFYVSSTDQIEARYLLTTSFLQRYKNIQKVFNANGIACSFLDNKLLIAVSVNKDLFSLGSLTKPLTDTTQFTTFFNEIVAIFEIVEELKLYDNSGM